MGERKIIRHDDFCASTRFWSAPCTCGAAAEQIVEDVARAFARDLAEIMKRAQHQGESHER